MSLLINTPMPPRPCIPSPRSRSVHDPITIRSRSDHDPVTIRSRKERSRTLILQQDTHELQAQLSNERVLREDLESKRIKTEEFLRNVSVALCCEYVQVVPIMRTTRCFLSIDPQSPCPRLKCRPLRLLITLHLSYISRAHTHTCNPRFLPSTIHWSRATPTKQRGRRGEARGPCGGGGSASRRAALDRRVGEAETCLKRAAERGAATRRRFTPSYRMLTTGNLLYVE